MGTEAGAALASSKRIAKIAFTGSTAVGKKIALAAASSMIPATLELGGKNALIVCPDYEDMGEAARVACGANFFNAGQICVGMSRVFIPEERYEAFVAAASTRAAGRIVGSQWDPDTEMGPLVDERQVSRVLKYIEQGVAEGAAVVCGGGRVPGTPQGTCFLQPTVLRDVTDSNVVAREEIFGPVMCCLRYPNGDLDSAIARANSTTFGLAATVLTNSIPTALRCARELLAGSVWVNTHGVFDPSIPYGGLKQSGWGKEYGEEGLDA